MAAAQEVGGDNLTRLASQEIARLNRELSELEPVVEALGMLRAKQAEVRSRRSVHSALTGPPPERVFCKAGRPGCAPSALHCALCKEVPGW